MQWLVMFLSVLCFWKLSNFQYDLYRPPLFRLVNFYVIYLAILVLVLCGMGTFFLGVKTVSRLYVVYILTCAFYLIVNLDNNPVRGTLLVLSIIFTTGLYYIVVDRTRLERFLWLNTGLGMVCIALNTVPLLHFYGIVELPYKLVTRIGGGDIASLMPLRDYGLFGRTENYKYALGCNRLQGWSFEPIHWAYFVLWTGVCCLLLWQLSRWRIRKLVLWPSLALLVLHLCCVQSAAAYIVVGISMLAVGTSWLFSFTSAYSRRIVVFVGIVLFGGLALPMALSSIPGAEDYFYAEQMLSKGQDWESNIKFFDLGDQLFTRLWPDPSFANLSGHNLILQTYLVFGILFMPMVLWLEWEYLKKALPSSGRMLQFAAILTLVVSNHQVPPQLFYPTGGMWLLTVAAAVNFAGQPHEPPETPKA